MVSNERPPRAPQDQIGPNSVHILTLLSILNKEKVHFRHQHCQGVCNNGLNWDKKVTNFIFNIHLEKFHPYTDRIVQKKVSSRRSRRNPFLQNRIWVKFFKMDIKYKMCHFFVPVQTIIADTLAMLMPKMNFLLV